jgi:hypothetical protein
LIVVFPRATKKEMAKGKGMGGKSNAYGDNEGSDNGRKIDGNSVV